MPDIFDITDLVDMSIKNNTTNYFMIADRLVKPISTKTLLELGINFCKLKESYKQDVNLRNWFDDGLLESIPITDAGSGGVVCSFESSGGGVGGSGITISATAPTSPTDGQTWIRSSDRVLFIYDSVRTKWLSESFMKVSAARNFATVTDQYLMSDEGIYTNQDPYVALKNSTIVGVVAKSTTTATWTLQLKDPVADTLLQALSVTSGKLLSEALNVNLDADQPLAFYLQGSSVGFPNVDLIVKYRG